MAFMHPLKADAFDAHWKNVLQDSIVIVRAVLIDDVVAGCISCFQADGLDSIGYWIGREFWGQGIATRALELLLNEVSVRPLHSRVAVSNIASLRVLQKCGFQVVRHEWSVSTDRYQECEEAVLELH